METLKRGQTGHKSINRLLESNFSSGNDEAPSNAIPGVLAVKASYTTDLVGDNNDLVITAAEFGVGGNDISFEYVTPSEPSQVLDYVVADEKIIITLATDSGAPAELAPEDGGYLLRANDVGVSGNSITLEIVDPSDTDAELEVNVASSAITVSLATDETGAITSTTQDVVNAINSYEDASDLVEAFVLGSSKIIDPIVETNLEGGLDPAVITTADQIRKLLLAEPMVSVTHKEGSTGEGAVTALAEQNLTGGVDYVAKVPATPGFIRTGSAGVFVKVDEDTWVELSTE